MLELSPTAQIFQTLKCASKSLHQLGVAAAAIEQQLTPVAEWSAKIAGGDAVIHVYGYGLDSNPADLGRSLAAMTARRGSGRALVPPWTPGTIPRWFARLGDWVLEEAKYACSVPRAVS